MLDCTNNIRDCYVSKLENNITLNGKVVKVYGQIPYESTPDNYIIISTINESADNNNQLFVTNATVDVDIFCEQYRKVDLSVADNIASQVLNLLLPTTGIHDVGDAYFQIFPLSRVASRYLPLENGDVYVARKILTINNSIIQK